MIIADIITELGNVDKVDLREAINGLRDVYRVFPWTLKKELLGEYSDTEYALMSALRSKGVTVADTDTIWDIYKCTES